MAGKIIIHGVKQFLLGPCTVTILIDNVSVATVKRNEIVEIPITHTCVLSTHWGASKPQILQIKNGVEIEIQICYRSGKVPLKILRETIIDPNAPDADPGVEVCEKPIYDIAGARGRHLRVYEDKCVISTKPTVGSFISGNVSDGDKMIYYSDIIGVQYKKPGYQLGYLQMETASALMNNGKDNFFNENSFTFAEKSMIEVEKATAFIKKKVDEMKKQKKNSTVSTASANVSVADELKKFKELLDLEVITQEEFDAKKKELLGL